MNERQCGPCTLCCKLFNVPEISKASGVWCPHATKSRGCAIYPGRPTSCREFRCAWLGGALGDEHRPDRIHGVVGVTTDSEGLVIHEDPGYPGVARAALRDVIANVLRGGRRVFVVRGQYRARLLAP